MVAKRAPRLQVGSAAWISEERASALQIAQLEVEEFSYSARNEMEWLNEHMAGIFDENEVNIAETFKTPGKLRGKTPRTIRKAIPGEARMPLSDVFAATPNGSTNLASNQLSRMKSPLPQTQMSKANLLFAKSPSPKRNVPSPKPVVPVQDSGYYGSQEINLADEVLNAERNESHSLAQAILLSTTTTVPLRQSLSRTAILDSPEKTFQTARENQTTRILIGETVKNAFEAQSEEHLLPENAENHVSERPDTLPTNSSPKSPVLEAQPDENSDDIRSPSEASSPIRPLVRKSSLNFASLPAREPLTAGKSLGGRISRTSHLDNGNNRTSYYHRAADGKSTGNAGKYDMVYDDNQDAMDVDGDILDHESPESAKVAQSHTKTYTQRLHDQISMLGKSQASNGSSKATSGHFTVQQTTDIVDPAVTPKRISPKKSPIKTTPGAFPQEDDDEDDEDDEDEWIEPPTATGENTDPRPILPKSYSADVMEGIHNKNTIGQIDLPVPKRLDRAPINNFGFPSVPIHAKSASVSTMPSAVSSSGMEAPRLMKTISVPNPGLEPVGEMDGPATPSKSPSRSFRDSPLKQVKNKLSSILKSSRGLLASSAAISAEGKSMLSPSATRLGLHLGGSSESIIPKGNLSSHNLELKNDGEETSSAKPGVRRTRASVEREKEEKRREKEAKRMAEQMDKLDRAREKEREKARVFSKEQEKMAVLEREIASKRHDESQMPQETPHPTRSSPRKAQVAEDVSARQSEDDVDMIDAQPSMPSASGSRSAGPSHIVRNKDIKRPVKPTKEAQTKTRQAPTVIRVNTGSQHSQYHTATTTSRVSTAAQDMIVPSNSQPQHQLSSKASLQTKPSAQSLKNLASAGRSKAMELAAKKKELEEREAQRRRETKADMERKRVIAQEEQRKQEQQRRLETERQKQKDREQVASQTEEKKSAQRQAAIEKAKQTRAPPPPTRSQPNGPPDTTSLQYKQVSTLSSQKADSQPNRPPSRMMSGIRSQDEPGRPVSVVLSSTAKTGTKRTLGADMVGDGQNQRPQSKAGPSYQAKDAKRRRTSENFDDELDMNHPPNIKGPPVRPSGGFKKDLPAKSVFQNGYTNVPQSATRDLFKATVTAQHNSHIKAAHPLDMAQISKGPIPFAPSSNAGGGSTFKTPARPGAYTSSKSSAKPATRSSPRFQNGDSIELPEIQTDDEDEDDEDGQGMHVAAWADSPDLRRALMRQETIDPTQIFGPPAPLNMEEVFNKSKDRWPKFRQRTSSANWSGLDRLTEDDIRKDMAARDKLRREGGWSYEMSKDMI